MKIRKTGCDCVIFIIKREIKSVIIENKMFIKFLYPMAEFQNKFISYISAIRRRASVSDQMVDYSFLL